MLAEYHVSLVALLLVIVLLTSQHWLALYVWWKVNKTIDEAVRRIAEDRTAGSKYGSGHAGRQEEQTQKHLVHVPAVEDLPLGGTSVARPPDWEPVTPVWPLWEDPP